MRLADCEVDGLWCGHFFFCQNVRRPSGRISTTSKVLIDRNKIATSTPPNGEAGTL